MSNRILVLSPSGNVLCEGESALAADAPNAPAADDTAPPTEPCPPTKRSPEANANANANANEGESGIFRRAERAA